MPGQMNYTFDDQNGQPQTLDDHDIATQLKGMGHDVQGVSADGQMLTIQQPASNGRGPPVAVQVPTANALRALGYKPTGMAPANPDTESVDPELSAMLQKLPDDSDMRQAYITAKMKRAGIDNPTVSGNGDDWHVFNPHTSQWIQITKSPGMDRAGLESAGLAIPHMLGMAAGGAMGTAAGAPTGLGAIATGAAGAAVGSAAGEGLTQYGLSKLDPDYAAALHAGKHPLQSIGTDVGMTALGDSVAHGASGVLGKVLPGMLKAPLSRSAQMLGDAAEGVGGFVDKTAGALKNGGQAISDATGGILSKDAAANAVGSTISPLATADMVGGAMQVPADIIGSAPELAQGASGILAKASRFVAPSEEALASSEPGSLGESFNGARSWLSDQLAGGSGKADLMSSRLATPRNVDQGASGILKKASQKVARVLGQSEEPGLVADKAPDVLGNAVSSSRANAFANDFMSSEEQGIREAAAKGGYDPDLAADTARSGMADMHMRINAGAPNWGDTAGGYVAQAAKAGRALTGMTTAGGKAMLGTAQALGKAGRVGGSLLNAAGTVAEPLELPALLRYGAPKAYNWWEDPQNK